MDPAVPQLVLTMFAAAAAWSVVVCGMKNKGWTIVLGVLLFGGATNAGRTGRSVYGAAPVPVANYQFEIAMVLVLLIWGIGAARLARPTSSWARWTYDGARMQAAAARFARRTRDAPPTGPPPAWYGPRWSGAGTWAIGMVAVAGVVGLPVLAIVLTCAATLPFVVLAAAGSLPSRFLAAAVAAAGAVASLVYTVDWTPVDGNGTIRALCAVLGAALLAAGLAVLVRVPVRSPGTPG